jgi:hypothetical protein
MSCRLRFQVSGTCCWKWAIAMTDLSVMRAAGEEDFVTAVFAELDPAGWIELVICGASPAAAAEHRR